METAKEFVSAGNFYWNSGIFIWKSQTVLDALKASALFRKDQYSYILYPNKELAKFTEKNNIPVEVIQSSELMQQLLKDGNTSVDGESNDEPLSQASSSDLLESQLLSHSSTEEKKVDSYESPRKKLSAKESGVQGSNTDEVSPRGIEEFAAHTRSTPERRSIREQLLDVFTCRTAIDETILRDENPVPNVLFQKEDDDSLGELTATTHEKQVDSAVHQERVDKARASFGDRNGVKNGMGNLFSCGYPNLRSTSTMSADSLQVDPEEEDESKILRRSKKLMNDDSSLDQTLPRGSKKAREQREKSEQAPRLLEMEGYEI